MATNPENEKQIEINLMEVRPAISAPEGSVSIIEGEDLSSLKSLLVQIQNQGNQTASKNKK